MPQYIVDKTKGIYYSHCYNGVPKYSAKRYAFKSADSSLIDTVMKQLKILEPERKIEIVMLPV